MLISIVAVLVSILTINCGTVIHSRNLRKVPQKLIMYTPEMVGASLLPARLLAWNMCHASHIKKYDCSQVGPEWSSPC